MERRNISLKALQELKYIDSLDSSHKEEQLFHWDSKYLISPNIIKNNHLNKKELQELSELFYKNILFLKNHKKNIKQQMKTTAKLKEFMNNL